jgi:Leucine-rich repeat (LRR) protein
MLDLNLRHNSLRKVDTSLSAMTQLQHLNLADCNVVTMAAALLHPLSRLTGLDLANNALRALPDDFFRHSYELRSLELSNNMLTSVTSLHHPGLSSLHSINLENNALVGIAPGFLDATPLLAHLGLAGNALTTLRNIPFLQWLHLSNVSLAENQLSNIAPRTFDGNPNLTFLQLQLNMLSELPTDLLAVPCRSLGHLNLERNRLSDLNASGIAQCQKLRYLALAHNRLAYLPDALVRNQELVFLDLGDNQLMQLPQEMVQLPRLTHFEVDHNINLNIADILGAASLPSLQMVNISNTNTAWNHFHLLEPVSLRVFYAFATDLSSVWLDALLHGKSSMYALGVGGPGVSSICKANAGMLLLKVAPSLRVLEVSDTTDCVEVMISPQESHQDIVLTHLRVVSKLMSHHGNIPDCVVDRPRCLDALNHPSGCD